MSKSALWTKGRPAALRVASEYRIPGLDPEDVRQEALEALWVGLDSYDPSRSNVPSFARLVSERRLISLLRAATRLKRTSELGFSLVPVDVETAVLHREQLAFALTDTRIEQRRRWRDTKRRQRAA